MTAVQDQATTSPSEPGRKRISRPLRLMLIAFVGVLVMTVTSGIVGTEDLTSSGTSGAALRLAIPILLAGLGGLFAERAGVVNIGLEGMMIAGTWFAAYGSFVFGPWHGLILAVVGGGLFGLIHAIATVTFNVDHIVSGVAINILGLGVMRFLSSIVYTSDTGGSVVQSPPIEKIGDVSLPFLGGGSLFGWESPNVLGWLEDQDWLYVSDVAGVLGGLFTSINWLTLIGLSMVPLTAFLLWKTAWGLRLRSCGEDPWAAESLGVNVLGMKYRAVIISGALAGLGGAFLVLVQAGIYREGMTAGRGFIGLGALIFGNWMPIGVLSGSIVFGFGDALKFRGSDVVRAFILALAIGLIAGAIWYFTKGKGRNAIVMGLTGLAFGAYALVASEVPQQLLTAAPYLITLFVLAVATQRLRMPAADGARYVKGEAH